MKTEECEIATCMNQPDKEKEMRSTLISASHREFLQSPFLVALRYFYIRALLFCNVICFSFDSDCVKI